MGIAIPFGFPRLSAKPNRNSFLRLRTLREAKSQFVFSSPGTPGSEIAIHFWLSEASEMQIAIHFWLPEASETQIVIHFWLPGASETQIVIHFSLH